jgi:biotin transport system substrate-specific component
MSNVSATTNPTTPKPGFSTRQLAVIGVMTAVTCILAPFSLPIGPVPISLTNLAIYFSLYVLGTKYGCVSYLVYLLIGFIGVPVFSGFTSGPGKLLGPTGGYLIGFIPMALVAGILIDKFSSKRIVCLLGMIGGTIIAYTFGTLWLAYQAGMDWKAALMAGVIPFVPGDLAKMVLAMIAGPQIRKQLVRAQLFPN